MKACRILKVVLFVVMALFVLLPATESAAVTWNVVGGELIGATGVDVGGAFYDVMFQEGTCAGLFGPCDSTGFTFTTQSDAVLAGNALADQVFVDTVYGNFDTEIHLTYGVEATSPPYDWGQIMTPYRYMPWNDRVNVAITYNTPGVEDYAWIGDVGRNFDTTNNVEFVYAVWSVAPEPISSTLFIIGGAILGFRRFRKKRNN